MEIQIKVIGILLLLLALLHVVFPKYFKWKKELEKLSLVNKEMMLVHTFFIALIVFLMGFLCLTSSRDLIETPLGKKVLLGFGIFWLARLFIQLFGYSTELWKGKSFETNIHILFVVLWSYFSFVFFVAGYP